MNYQQFSIEEREEIQLGLWRKESIRSIAKKLQRSPSSVSREVRRHLSPEKHRYTPRIAHAAALAKRSSRGRSERLKISNIRFYVITKLKQGFSPEQIAGRMKTDLPGFSISHESIYQYIYAQIHRDGYGLLKPGCEDLRPLLKRRHKRRTKKGMRKGQRVSKLRGPSIDGRPRIVEQRLRIGDWESDTIASKNNAPGLNSLVERTSGLVFLTKVSDKTAYATRKAIVKRLKVLPRKVRATLTMDNGAENQQWREIQKTLGIACFFAHPYHAWERGTNENTNGLVRWYFPKGTDFRIIPDAHIAQVEYFLNTRPRKRLGYQTPLEVFIQSVALLA
jgi:transposase, IS30 family